MTLFAVFFFSGASALAFETVWQRLLFRVFGASAPATTAILTAFFCGIAFGSYLGGGILRRVSNVYRFYAFAELTIAVWGVVIVLVLPLVDTLYVGLFRWLEPTYLASGVYRFVMSVLVILPATLAMGATLPAMNRILVEQDRKVGASVSLAYGFNTVGAVLGTLCTGFLLLPALGIQRTLWFAASFNTIIFFIVFLMSRRIAPSLPREERSMSASEISPWHRVFVIVYFMAGFAALGFEVVWFRLLALFTTNSSLTFALLLSTYLFGFGAGSLLLYPLLARRMRKTYVFALSSWGAGMSALCLIPLFYRFADIRKALLYEAAVSLTLTLGRVIAAEAAVAAAMMLIPAIFMGLAYPALCALLIADKADTGRKSGSLYFIGTLGSMSGALVVGAFAIPFLGLTTSLAGLCALCLILGSISAQAEQNKARWGLIVFVGLGALGVAGSVWYGATATPLLRAGRVEWRDGYWQHRGGGSKVLRYKEGVSATIAVKEEGGAKQRRLYVDGQHVAATDPGAKVDAKMLAHLPLLLHPSPKRALTVGFGSGGTSWSLTRHQIDAHAVEIEPEVPRSAHLFEAQNHGVLKQPNFTLILNDARDYLHVTEVRYDVISTDVTNLQYRQNSSLYTVEYFELMKARLTDDGIGCAWIPMGAISDTELKILVKSFATAFEHTSLWYMNHLPTTFGILIGTPTTLRVDLERIRQGLADPSIQRDLSEIDIDDAFQFVNFLLLDSAAVASFVGDVPLHTDDHPILEFTSPLSFYSKYETLSANLSEALTHRPADIKPLVANLTPAEVQGFDMSVALAQRSMEVIWRLYLDRTKLSPIAKRDNLKRALEFAQEAVRAAPANSSARSLLNRVQRRLRSLER